MAQPTVSDSNLTVETPVIEAGLDFGALLDDYAYEAPHRGQLLDGIVVSVSETEALVDLGLKRDGIVPRSDMDRLDEATRAKVTPGAEVSVYVLRTYDAEGDLIVSINRGLQAEDWKHAEALLESGELVTCRALESNRGGLVVQFGRLRGFVPRSHLVDIPRHLRDAALREALAPFIGRELTLCVIELNRRRNRLVLSERRAQRAAQLARMAELEQGTVVTGTVASLVSFGAFVDIGGVDGLIHISNLAHSYIENPAEVLKVGDEVQVRIDEIDMERERIGLNRKALLPDPWQEAVESLQEGALLTGRVTNAVDFGLFVEILPGIEGLVHLNQMANYGLVSPELVAKPGDELLVRIIGIDRNRQRISLSLDAVSASEEQDWLAGRAAADDAQPEDTQDAVTASEEQDRLAGRAAADDAQPEDTQEDALEDLAAPEGEAEIAPEASE